MRIVILADRLIVGGLETHIITYSNELLRRGHQLLLYTAHTEPDILAQIHNQNHNFHYLFWSGDPVKDLSIFQPEIIHAHPFTAIVKGYEIAQVFRKPLFITMHGLYDFGLDRSPLGNLISKRVQKIIAVDQGVAKVLKNCTAHPEKIIVIPNGIDLATFYPQAFNREERKQAGLSADWYTITIISRFDDGKERPIRQLLQCAQDIANALSGLNLIIVGSGSHFSELKILADQLPRNRNLGLHFVGYQNDVRKFIAWADLCLACDRAALEAMACHRPVFAINGSGFAGVIDSSNFREVLLSRGNYHEINNNELVNGLINILKNRSYLQQLADTSLEIVRRNFDISDSVDKLEKVFTELIH